jgi:transposase
MDLRVQLIQDYDEGESVAGLAEMYGVARRTVYKWLARHDARAWPGSPTGVACRCIRRVGSQTK